MNFLIVVWLRSLLEAISDFILCHSRRQIDRLLSLKIDDVSLYHLPAGDIPALWMIYGLGTTEPKDV